MTGALKTCPGARSIEFSNDFIVTQCSNPADLEAHVTDLLDCGFNMTRDGRFADFAIVHGVHGLALPCDWLELRNVQGGGMVSLKTAAPDALAFADDIFSCDESGWITELGHGFMLSREQDYDLWLDFNTGRTIVSLKPTASHSTRIV